MCVSRKLIRLLSWIALLSAVLGTGSRSALAGPNVWTSICCGWPGLQKHRWRFKLGPISPPTG